MPEALVTSALLAPVSRAATVPSSETIVEASATVTTAPSPDVVEARAAATRSEVVIADRATTVVVTPSPETLFPKGLLHSSTIAHILTSKFALGTPHYRLEQALADQGMPLDRGMMSRYVEHAGNTLGATIVAAMWRDAIANGTRSRRMQPPR